MIKSLKLYYNFFFIFFLCLACNNKLDNKKTDIGGDKNILKSNRSELKDSIIKEQLLDSSYHYLKTGDSVLFFKTNSAAINITEKLNDTLGNATAFWDRGQFYYHSDVMDSAYFYYDKAQKKFAGIGNKKRAGQLLLNMAVIQGYYKNYTGSEILLSEAINFLKDQNAKKSLYFAYNNLGSLSRDLKEFERSIFYYKKSEEYLNEIDEKSEYPSLWNNIGVVYTSNKDYEKALEYYHKGLNVQSKLKKEDVDLEIKAMLIDNLAYARQNLLDTSGIYEDYSEALKIRKDKELYAGQSMSYLHLSEYFILKQDTAKAIELAQNSKIIAAKINATENYLQSLKLLADIDIKNALGYTKEYVELSDSLYFAERVIRNKFARIRFETDEYISETKKLNQRIVKISIIAGIILIIAILIYIIKDQRSKNKLIQQKQKANQEIYNLILEQQKYYEEGREREKLHLSRELHDGVLGKLFGLRISLDILNEDDTRESKDNRKKYINEIATVAKEIRDISHKLSESNFVEVNFKVVLEELINQQKVYRFNVDFDIDEKINWDNINNNIKINIYRILQEAFTNIYKHAEANNVKISIFQKQLSLHLTIKDDGKGFDLNKSPGIGVKNMKSRSKSIGADFSIASKLNEGTIITVSVKI